MSFNSSLVIQATDYTDSRSIGLLCPSNTLQSCTTVPTRRSIIRDQTSIPMYKGKGWFTSPIFLDIWSNCPWMVHLCARMRRPSLIFFCHPAPHGAPSPRVARSWYDTRIAHSILGVWSVRVCHTQYDRQQTFAQELCHHVHLRGDLTPCPSHMFNNMVHIW